MLKAVVKASMDGCITAWGENAPDLFGWTADEIIGQRVSRIVPERFRAAHEAGITRFARTRISRGLVGNRLEVYGLHKSGVEFPLSVYLTVEGETFINVMEDISERRKEEDALRVKEDIPVCSPYVILLVEPVLADQQAFLATVRSAWLANSVVIAVSAAEALAYASKINRYFGWAPVPYVVVTEQLLPDATGEGLIAELEAHRTPPITSIICTRAITATNPWRKPITPDDLMARLPNRYLAVV